MFSKTLIPLCLLAVTFASCRKNRANVQDIDPALFGITSPEFPTPNIPADNPLTESKISLGRMLFYDTKLSSDNTISCASCHTQNNAFSDANQFSTGVNGAQGDRQGMAIFN